MRAGLLGFLPCVALGGQDFTRSPPDESEVGKKGTGNGIYKRRGLTRAGSNGRGQRREQGEKWKDLLALPQQLWQVNWMASFSLGARHRHSVGGFDMVHCSHVSVRGGGGRLYIHSFRLQVAILGNEGPLPARLRRVGV
ncbi:hypothetical protein B0T22DRAFT_48721 [Podospora appendiculata]|uniref:Secreted protein n=1 Tax=Podospora appendiculata TaxID=314037 RepID=A0AAE1CGQ5_9PEZI|nr:hypothetical protein B0T22DRAFT_48721 [Podospora appendiculata]